MYSDSWSILRLTELKFQPFFFKSTGYDIHLINIGPTVILAHSGFELWFREKKSSWHMTFIQS